MTTALTLESIPHRPPFLFVDDIVEVSEARITVTKFVDPESDFFRGHYPGEPVMPGVLICEACFQAGALLIAQAVGSSTGDHDASIGVPVLTRITDARFKRIVRPGETLDIVVSLDEELGGAYFMTGRASVRGVVCVRVVFACMLAKQGEGAGAA